MKKYLKRLPPDIRELIKAAQDAAEVLNYNAFLVGGFVRDLILKVKNLDLDIVVEPDGIRFAEALAQKLKARLVRHKRFGTATLMLKPHLKIDVASARKEFYPYPASLPVVSQGSLRDDLGRRDFTINTLAISLNLSDFGRLLDFFNGKNDLAQKKVRILHDLSFIDDPTRILRAIRFEQRYDFKIEEKTLKNLKKAVKLKMLGIVEPQRLREEIILLLKEKNPLKAIKRIKKLIGFDFIFPRLPITRKSYRLIGAVDKEVKWFKEKCPHRRHPDIWLIYFMALLDPLNIKQARRVCRKFVFTKGEEKRILSYFSLRSKIISKLSQTKVKPSSIFSALEPLSYEVLILLKAKARLAHIQKRIQDFLRIYNGTEISLGGHDLKGLGLAPGPHYQQIFRQVLNARLNGRIKSHQEELEFVRKLKNIHDHRHT
jgi:tRNA nucleotidyltransferase (CCA-adding enzyme)